MRALPYLVLACALLAPARAHGDKKSEAKEHFERASTAHQEGRYADALTELNIAYSLDPQPNLLYAIGQIYVMQGQCSDAIPFYQRFLASKPEPSEAAKAKTHEAIDTCKRLQPKEPVKPEKVIITVPGKTTTVSRTTSPWYSDGVGDTFLILGLGAGAASGWFYNGAIQDRDRADQAASYAAYSDLLVRAERKQKYAMACAGGGGLLVTIALISYLVRDRTVERRTVAVVPAAGGALVTWGGRF